MSSSPPMKQAENGTAMGSSSEPTASSGMHAGREAVMPKETNKDNLITVEPLKRSEMQPSYAQTLPIDEVQGFYGSMINCLGGFAGTLGSIPFCFCCPNPYKEVRQGSVGLVQRFGQFYKSTDPGLVKINPFSENLSTINIQIQVVNVPQQSVMTKDNVQVSIDSVIYYHVRNPYKAAFGIADVRMALIERAQSTLRHVVGARQLQSLVTEREEIAREIEEIVEQFADNWGVAVESILIKDILFSRELQESLSSAAQAKRVGESKVIAARAEVDSARLMREAADILSSPAAIQIRQLEALQNMSKNSGSKVIFVPMSLQGMGSHEANKLPGGSGGQGGSTSIGSGQLPETAAHIHQMADM